MASDVLGPQVSDVHVNRPLTTISIAYMNTDDMFIGHQIAPGVNVSKKSDSYFIYDKGDFLRIQMAQRAPGGVYPMGGYGLTTTTYTCIEFALATAVDDETRDNADSPLSPDEDAIAYLTHQGKLKREYDVATLLTNTSNFTNSLDVSGTAQWDDFANSNPIAEVWAGRKTIRKAVMKRPNVFVVASEVMEDAFMDHPDILDRIKYTERANEQSIRNALAGIFGVDKVLEGAAVYNTANPGATDSFSDLWGDHALLAYVAPRPKLRDVTMASTFEWMGPRITTVRDNLTDSDIHRIKYAYDAKLVAELCGYLFDNAT